ncbi:MAG: enoyl-CoA hydratase/isomerase family protein [bacterium]
MAQASAIVTDVTGSIGLIRFNQPTARNPLSIATLTELGNTIASLTARENLTAIIFTGTYDVFASGADIRELAQLSEKDALEFARFGQKLFQTIADAKQVTIAAINGYCMGGALDLALACDIRIASPQAVFAHPGARLGIITGWGGTQRLPRLIGRARALELFATTGRLTSQEALDMRLVTSIAMDALESALTTAREIQQEKGAKPEDLAPEEKES